LPRDLVASISDLSNHGMLTVMEKEKIGSKYTEKIEKIYAPPIHIN
jgi:hypothetical protein